METYCQNQPVMTASSSILNWRISPAVQGKSRGAPGLKQPGTALPRVGSCSAALLAAGSAALPLQLLAGPPPTFREHSFPLICKICPFSSLTLRPLCHQQWSLIAVSTVDRIN